MEQIRQIYRWKSLLFGLVRQENYGSVFDVGEGIHKKKTAFPLKTFMVLPVTTPPLVQMLTDHNTGGLLFLIKALRMNECSGICTVD